MVGAITKKVWEIAERIGPRRKRVITACIAEGINASTASTQYSKWMNMRRRKEFNRGWVALIIETLGRKYNLLGTGVKDHKEEFEQLINYPIPAYFSEEAAAIRFVEDFENIIIPVMYADKRPAPTDDDQPTVLALSNSAQAKLDAAIRAEVRKLQLEFQAKVEAEIKRRLDEFILPKYNAKMKDYDRVIKARRGIMPRADFRKILAALHPDQRDTDKLTEAFSIFKEHELAICSEKELPTDLPTNKIPQTVEEMLAQREEVKRQRAAQRSRAS